MIRRSNNPTKSINVTVTRLGGTALTTLVSSLQYENRKAEYFKAVWDVVNWKAAEKRFK